MAAELSRRGFIATTFTGNIPEYDIVAVDESGGHALVQVKAITGTSWQFDLRKFVQVTFEGQRQILGQLVSQPYRDLVCVLVQLRSAETDGLDRLFVLPWLDFRRIVVAHHKRYLARCGGIRPRKYDSMHTAVSVEEVAKWEDRWDILTARVKPVRPNTERRAL